MGGWSWCRRSNIGPLGEEQRAGGELKNELKQRHGIYLDKLFQNVVPHTSSLMRGGERNSLLAFDAYWSKFIPRGIKCPHLPSPFGKLLGSPDPRPCSTELHPSLHTMGRAVAMSLVDLGASTFMAHARASAVKVVPDLQGRRGSQQEGSRDISHSSGGRAFQEMEQQLGRKQPTT